MSIELFDIHDFHIKEETCLLWIFSIEEYHDIILCDGLQCDLSHRNRCDRPNNIITEEWTFFVDDIEGDSGSFDRYNGEFISSFYRCCDSRLEFFSVEWIPTIIDLDGHLSISDFDDLGRDGAILSSCERLSDLDIFCLLSEDFLIESFFYDIFEA